MKVLCFKTRWYFRTVLQDGCEVVACVEFSDNEKGKREVHVLDYTGTRLLWKSTGIQRTDRRTAQLAFQLYAESEAKKLIHRVGVEAI